MLQTFRTKKKLSNARHVLWIIAFVVAIGLGYLFILIEFVKMHSRNVLFYNLRTVNIPAFAQREDKPKVYNYFEKNSPIFIIYSDGNSKGGDDDKVIFGTMQSLVLPKLKKDSLILSKSQLKEDFRQKISTYKNLSPNNSGENALHFPAKVVGVSFVKNLPYNEQLKIMNDIYIVIKEKNGGINPSIVFIDTLPAQPSDQNQLSN